MFFVDKNQTSLWDSTLNTNRLERHTYKKERTTDTQEKRTERQIHRDRQTGEKEIHKDVQSLIL